MAENFRIYSFKKKIFAKRWLSCKHYIYNHYRYNWLRSGLSPGIANDVLSQSDSSWDFRTVFTYHTHQNKCVEYDCFHISFLSLVFVLPISLWHCFVDLSFACTLYVPLLVLLSLSLPQFESQSRVSSIDGPNLKRWNTVLNRRKIGVCLCIHRKPISHIINALCMYYELYIELRRK